MKSVNYYVMRLTVKIVLRRAIKERSSRLQDFSLEVADIHSLPQRLYKTGLALSTITQSSGVKLYLVDKAKNEIYFCSADEKTTTRNRISWNIRKINSLKRISPFFDKICFLLFRTGKNNNCIRGLG